jgi:urate oxidase
MAELTHARYGKDNIRLYKVHRAEDTEIQFVAEMTVGVLLEGDIETSYVDSNHNRQQAHSAATHTPTTPSS